MLGMQGMQPHPLENFLEAKFRQKLEKFGKFGRNLDKIKIKNLAFPKTLDLLWL